MRYKASDLSDFFRILEAAGLIRLSSKIDAQNAAEAGEDLTFDALGADSLTMMEIAAKVEEAYAISISPEKIISLKSVMQLYRYISHQNQK